MLLLLGMANATSAPVSECTGWVEAVNEFHCCGHPSGTTFVNGVAMSDPVWGGSRFHCWETCVDNCNWTRGGCVELAGEGNLCPYGKCCRTSGWCSTGGCEGSGGLCAAQCDDRRFSGPCDDRAHQCNAGENKCCRSGSCEDCDQYYNQELALDGNTLKVTDNGEER